MGTQLLELRESAWEISVRFPDKHFAYPVYSLGLHEIFTKYRDRSKALGGKTGAKIGFQSECPTTQTRTCEVRWLWHRRRSAALGALFVISLVAKGMNLMISGVKPEGPGLLKPGVPVFRL